MNISSHRSPATLRAWDVVSSVRVSTASARESMQCDLACIRASAWFCSAVGATGATANGRSADIAAPQNVTQNATAIRIRRVRRVDMPWQVSSVGALMPLGTRQRNCQATIRSEACTSDLGIGMIGITTRERFINHCRSVAAGFGGSPEMCGNAGVSMVPPAGSRIGTHRERAMKAVIQRMICPTP